MHSLLRNRYRKSTISAKSEATLEEVKRLQERSLDRRCIALSLDGLIYFMRRDTVEKETVTFSMGIKETG